MALPVSPEPISATSIRVPALSTPQRDYPLASVAVGVFPGGVAMPVDSFSYPIPEMPAPPPLTGVETITSFHTWYYRIHVVPVTVELGSVTSDQTRVVYLWNAFFESKTIESATLETSGGMSLGSPVTPPAEILPLQVLYYNLFVSSDGPPLAEGTITWVIEGQEYVVPITGTRRILFSWGPNWSAQVTDTLQWATSVNKAWSGREQRAKLARFPRRALRYTLRLLQADKTQRFDSAIYGWQARLFMVPIWQEGSKLQLPVAAGAAFLQVDTRGMTLQTGGSVLLYIDSRTNEMAEVLSFTATSIVLRGPLQGEWPVGTRVFPCVDALPLGDFSTNRQVPGHIDAQVGFTSNPGSGMLRADGGAVPITYRGVEVYYGETDWAAGIDVDLVPNGYAVDNGMATLQPVRRGDFPEMSRTFRWTPKSRTEAAELRQFFCRRAGRFRPVWLPSGTDDFTIAGAIETVSNSIVVMANDYASLVRMQAGRRDIVIMLRNGRRLARRIVETAEAGDRMVLTLDTGFDEGVLPGEIKRISFLGHYRMSDDFVTFSWLTDQQAVVESNFTLTEPDE